MRLLNIKQAYAKSVELINVSHVKKDSSVRLTSFRRKSFVNSVIDTKVKRNLNQSFGASNKGIKNGTNGKTQNRDRLESF